MADVSLYQVGKVLGVNSVSTMAPQVGLTWPPPPPISVKHMVGSPRTLQNKVLQPAVDDSRWHPPRGQRDPQYQQRRHLYR